MLACSNKGTYIEIMARGWESKGVESQIEDRGRISLVGKSQNLPADEQELKQRKRGLLLDRTRIWNDLQSSTSARYQETLRAALAHLDDQIAKVDASLKSI